MMNLHNPGTTVEQEIFAKFALDLHNPKIHEIFLLLTSRCRNFVNFYGREIFLLYSIPCSMVDQNSTRVYTESVVNPLFE